MGRGDSTALPKRPEVSGGGSAWKSGLSSFWVRGACVGVLMGGVGSFLSGVQQSVQYLVLRCLWVCCDSGQPVF